MPTRRRIARAAVAVALLAVAASAQVEIYVDDDATGANDGTSWDDAFLDLRDALLVAGPDDVVRVAQGTYRPDGGTLLRELSFALPDGAELRGAYAGVGAPDPNMRDLVATPSILDGDLLGDDLPGFVNRDDNSLHVLVALPGADDLWIEGFRIRGGNADGPAPDDSGGGARIGAENTTVLDCTFTDNRADGQGGGAWLLITEITGCAFVGNAVGAAAVASARGGGLYGVADTVTDCTFDANLGTGSPLVSGVGWYAPFGSTDVSNCSFSFNLTTQKAFGVGAQIATQHDAGTVTGCLFFKNWSSGPDSRGGGLLAAGELDVFGCVFAGNGLVGADSEGGGLHGGWIDWTVEARRCVFTGNSSTSPGGGVCASYLVRLENCTIVGNRTDADAGGGVKTVNLSDEGAVRLQNCIVWDNQDGGGATGETDQVWWVDGGSQWDVPPDLLYNCIQGYTGLYPGVGNIADDPLLADADGPDDVYGTLDDDVQLLPGSPCIDAGNPASPLDLDGTIADIGAYQVFQDPVPPVWVDLGSALAGLLGPPTLMGDGTLLAGEPTTIDLTDALPLSLAFLVLSLSELSAPFKGGVLVPAPDVLIVLGIPGTGAVPIAFAWPPNIPSGTSTWWQYWIQDPGGPQGWAASNAIRGTTP